MSGRATILRAVVMVLVALAIGAPARASNAPPAKGAGANRAHPEAAKINRTNPRVIHAGPGTPFIGGVFTPPGAGKKEKKD
jgi:hypothetical protein